MTRIEKARAREAKARAAEDMVRGPIDELFEQWSDRPSLLADALLDYAVGVYAAINDFPRQESLISVVQRLSAKHMIQ